MKRIFWILLLLPLVDCRSAVSTSTAEVECADEKSPQEIFEKRIVPIFKSRDPSSCAQCHLGGVDLKNYILPTHEQTFVSLRDQGLIDLEKPEKSKILALIQMGIDDKSKSSLIHQKMRKAEMEAFADWIARSAADPKLRGLPKLKAEELAKPKRPVEVIRHERKDRLLDSFEVNIWPMRFRCMGCHTEGTPENKKHIQEHGERMAWFKAAGPEATLDYLRETNLIDVKNPEKSLLLRKPLNEVKHGGGQKFVMGDQGYKAFRTFIEDYARIVNDQYTDAATLPKSNMAVRQFGTGVWFKVSNTPDAWGDKLLQVNLYAWDENKKTWETEPIATSDRLCSSKAKIWQHTLTLLAPKDSDRAKTWAKTPALPRGRYLVKIWVDRDGRLAKDWRADFGKEDYMGQIEVQSAWPEGYGKMTVVDGARVTR